MNVYLFELDSVRCTEEDILQGQIKMLREIAVNGNTIILSFNQLTDSVVFWAGLQEFTSKNKKPLWIDRLKSRRANPGKIPSYGIVSAYEHIIGLYELGRIRVCPYGNIRTAAQYVLKHIDGCLKPEQHEDEFQFSLLRKIASMQTSMQTDIVLKNLKLAIKNSDINLLKEKAEAEPDNQKLYLFLYNYAKLILLISMSDTAIQAQKENRRPLADYLKMFSDYSNLDETILQKHAINFENLQTTIFDLQKLSMKYENAQINLNSRSAWYKLIENELTAADKACARGIIDLCYNYKIRDSIAEIEGSSSSGNRIQLTRDLCDFIKSAENNQTPELNQNDAVKELFLRTKDLSQVSSDWNHIQRDWAGAHCQARNNAKILEHFPGLYGSAYNRDQPYEKKLKTQRFRWIILTLVSALSNLLVFGILTFIIFSLNKGKDLLTGLFESRIPFLWYLLLFIVFEFLYNKFSEEFRMPDITESVRNFLSGINVLWMLNGFDKRYKRKAK